MKQITTVFDRSNIALGQLDTNVPVAWYYNRPMSTVIDLSSVNTGLRAELLRAGNRVLVETEGLPAWVGVILPPEAWDEAGASFTLHGAEKIFEGRWCGTNDIFTGAGGAVFAALVGQANAGGWTGIDIGIVDQRGGSITRNYHREEVGDAMNKLASDLSATWWVDGEEQGGRLIMRANFSRERGGDYSRALIDGETIENVRYFREGFFANRVQAVGQSADWTKPLLSDVYQDTDSQARHGVWEYAIMAVNASDKNTLNALAASALARFSRPRHGMTATIACTPPPAPGDRVLVELPERGFGDDGSIGVRFWGRVRELACDPESDTVTVLVKEGLDDGDAI